jgi:putative membrane protein
MVGWLPGITNAYATSFSLGRRRSSESVVRSASSYLVTYSATNVGGSLQSIIAMGTILRFRNGTLEAVGSNFPGDALLWHDALNLPVSMLAFLWAACISIVLGASLCRSLGSRMLSRGHGSEPHLMRPSVLLLLVSLSFIFSGPAGLLVLISCFLIGSWAISIGAPRIHLMGVLLVPVIVFFMTQ